MRRNEDTVLIGNLGINWSEERPSVHYYLISRHYENGARTHSYVREDERDNLESRTQCVYKLVNLLSRSARGDQKYVNFFFGCVD